MNLMFKKPALGTEAFVAPTAAVIGSVQLGQKSSVWYGCVLRGRQLICISWQAGWWLQEILRSSTCARLPPDCHRRRGSNLSWGNEQHPGRQYHQDSEDQS